MKQINKKLKSYINKYKLNDLINYHDFKVKKHALMETVDRKNRTPVFPEWYDLVNLHRKIIDNKIINVMEFGVGYSTIVMAHALKINEKKYGKYVKNNFRKKEPFKVFSIDSDKKFINYNNSKIKKLNLKNYCKLIYSKTYLSTFNDRICSYYNTLPNILPDLIYIDGPGLYDVENSINGINLRSIERFPLSGDLLKIEYTLLPGCIIIIDGRKTNGRFLKNNFQRNWKYKEDYKNDYCEFYLNEKPIGQINKKQINFSKNT